MRNAIRGVMFSVVLLACGTAVAAIEIPKASGKALGVTRGKPFSKGLVFVDGKYIAPPYTVERWGVGIRINGTPVIAQVIDWTEFLKTQDGVKVTKTETAPTEIAEPEPEPDMEFEEEEDDSDTSLDDLFDDDPKPKKPEKKAAKKRARKPRPPKPTTTVSITFDGEFIANDASDALVKKINKTRTDINATLLSGGFICFGQNYAQVSGDARIAAQVLSKLPDIEKSAQSEADLIAGVNAAGLVYLTESICRDFYRNRVDYLKLQERREKQKNEEALKRLLEGSGELNRL